MARTPHMKSMRLICPLKPSAERGGSHNFLLSVAGHMSQFDVEMVFGLPDTLHVNDVLLVNSFLTPLKDVLSVWKRDIPVLLRLDGAARDYGRFDDADQKQGRIARLADEIIFQSEYCRRRLNGRWGIVRKAGRVIYNGVDTNIFSPSGEKKALAGTIKVAYVSHSANLLKGFRHLVHLARTLPQVTFIACTAPHPAGWPDEALGSMPPPPNLLLPGRVPQEELPAVLRGCDLFMFPSINDSCSSAVLEAIACGLPIWYHPSGGTPELVGDAGVAFSDNPESDLQRLLEYHADFSARARERAEKHFDIRHVARQYVEAAEEALNRKKNGKVQRMVRRVIPAGPLFARDVPLPALTIGYYLPHNQTAYENVPGSLWIRCFQMVRPLAEMGINILINPGPDKPIDLAVILRLENERGVAIARTLRQKEIPYIFDMVVNYLDRVRLPHDESREVTEKQYESALRLMEGAVLVTTVSPWLADRASFFHPRTICIPDAVPDRFFDATKDKSDFDRLPLRACYVGYSAKSRDLLDWLPALRKQGIEVTVVSDKPPPAGLNDVQWRKWAFTGLPEEMARHEIGLAPRSDMSNPYNMGHSSFKIASLMACGLPVIASPVPAYAPLLGDGRAGRIVHALSDFETVLQAMISDRNQLRIQALEARHRSRDLAVSRVKKQMAHVFRQAVAISEAEEFKRNKKA